jgi:hypothetical protein
MNNSSTDRHRSAFSLYEHLNIFGVPDVLYSTERVFIHENYDRDM